MPVGELFLSAFIQVLFGRLASPELLRFLRQEGLYSKIKKWEDTLKMIQAVLGDAEDKQLTNSAVKMWLDKLQDLAYDAEDLLDEFATEALARKLKIEQQQASTSKGLNLLPARFKNWSPGAILGNIRMRSEIKNVTIRLEELFKLKYSLGLTEIIGGTSSYASLMRPQTTYLPTELAVHGRDADKKKILEMVLKNEPSDAVFRVIPIVGKGGIGKTTLAREVYNDMASDSFDIKAWVCVSDDFDVPRVSTAILESITGSYYSLEALDAVQTKLKQEVAGRKFLLVLDDVWSKDYAKWETLKSPFIAGAFGSRIIVTTRLREVAFKMSPGGFYQLDLLPNEDCWSVFTMYAFDNGDIPAYLSTELIRQKVVERSGGLPLAAKTLGGLLRSKHPDGWLKILNSEIWDLYEETEIPTSLRLSYYHLPSHLKRCFSYCSIFPKDYEFEEEELVLLWIADGLVQRSTNNKSPKDLGREYFQDLLSRSIFQRSSGDNNSKFGMHDLVNDLAQSVSGERSFRLEHALESHKPSEWFQRARHSSYICGAFDGKSKFDVFHDAEY